MILGYLDGIPLPRAPLDQRLARMRSGPRASALPVPGSPEDRQLTRWVAQVLLTEALCESEATTRGLTPLPFTGLSQRAAVEFGSITSAAYEGNGQVRALYEDVTTTIQVREKHTTRQVRELHVNGEFFAEAHSLPREFHTAQLGETVMVQGMAFTIAGERTATKTEVVHGSERRVAFVRWLDHARAHRLRLVPGLEHPGDPAQPDNHHRH